MKTTQVVSGFLFGASLFAVTLNTNAQVVFDDGAVHTVNDASLRDQTIVLQNGSTLQIEAGAVIGGDLDQSGTIMVYDTSIVDFAGGQLGGAGGSSGSVYLYDTAQFTMESGQLGGTGYGSGQVYGFNNSAMSILGGTIGGSGDWSGVAGLFDTSFGEIHGGTFGGTGSYAGTVITYATSALDIYLCQANQPFGPLVTDSTFTLTGTWKDGTPTTLNFMREATATITLVQDCATVVVDSDGDGVPDNVDQCPDSDLRPTVWIRNFNTRIPNQIGGQPVNSQGCSLADLVDAVVESAAANAHNRGEFLRAVALGLRELQKEGLLPGRLCGPFLDCAGRCRWDDRSNRFHHERHGFSRRR